jgi:hypothetical protein
MPALRFAASEGGNHRARAANASASGRVSNWRPRAGAALFTAEKDCYTASEAAVAQLVEHRIRNAGVVGSNPICGTTVPRRCHGQPTPRRMFQKINHLEDFCCIIRNDGVGASNPSCGTSKKSRQIRTLLALRRIAAVRVFGNSHDFSHVWDGLDGRAYGRISWCRFYASMTIGMPIWLATGV